MAMVSCMASMPTIAGVPLMKRLMPGAGTYSGPIAKASAVPSQPRMGCASTSCRSART